MKSRKGELNFACADVNFTLLLATSVTEPEIWPVNTISLPDSHACFLSPVAVKSRLIEAIGVSESWDLKMACPVLEFAFRSFAGTDRNVHESSSSVVVSSIEATLLKALMESDQL